VSGIGVERARRRLPRSLLQRTAERAAAGTPDPAPVIRNVLIAIWRCVGESSSPRRCAYLVHHGMLTQ